VTKPVLIILHQEHSTPGRVGYALRQRGFTLDLRRPPLGEALPNNLKDYSGVVIFGGPMSANDPDAFIGEEIKLIERTLKAETPFLGLCLGAQLLCRAMGTRVYNLTWREMAACRLSLAP
jgi:GMP synthase (glutamine-hydrolysing)